MVGANFPILFVVCGYHARAYHPSVVHPFFWTLERVRAWQMSNIEKSGRAR